MKVNQTEQDDKSNVNVRNNIEYRIEYENELLVITPTPKKRCYSWYVYNYVDSPISPGSIQITNEIAPWAISISKLISHTVLVIHMICNLKYNQIKVVLTPKIPQPYWLDVKDCENDLLESEIDENEEEYVKFIDFFSL
jgi:hypothetical protein